MSLVKKIVTLLAVAIPLVTYGQGTTDFYQKVNQPIARTSLGLRTGLNYSIPTVAATEVGDPLPLPQIAGLVPRYGYYLGAFINKPVAANRLLLRLDATLQMKGLGAAYNGQIVSSTKYYSIGVTPLIGLRLTNKLTVLTGLEANYQLARSKPYPYTTGYLFELGTTFRFTYSFGHFGLEAGYFRGFTPYDQSAAFRLPGSSAINNFYNQTVQAGIVFQLDQ